MNLTQFLALWRAADTPEKRSALIAGLSTAQRQALNPAVIARVNELDGTANRTEELNNEFRDMLDAAEALDAVVRADAATTARVQALATATRTAPIPVTVTPRSDDPTGPTPAAPDAPAWRNNQQGAFRSDSEIARRIAGDLYAHGLQDRQIEHLASADYRNELITWMRSCASNPMQPLTRALNEVTIDGGGAVVPLDFIAEIIQRRAATRRVSGLVRRYQTSRDSISIPKFLGGDSMKKNDLVVQWAGAEGAVTEDTSLQAWGNVEIKIHRGGILIVADRGWLEDAAFDMEAWVVEQITDMYEANLDALIINGSGNGRPFGLTTRTGTTTAAANLITCVNIGDPISYEGLMIQQGNLDEQYAANASYLFRRSALYTQVLGIMSTTGQPVLGTPNTTMGGTMARVDSQLLGVPVVQSDNMAAVGAGNKVNYFGDLRQAYALAERVALQIEPYISPTLQAKDQRGWYVRFRLGGDVTAEWALRCGLNTDV